MSEKETKKILAPQKGAKRKKKEKGYYEKETRKLPDDNDNDVEFKDDDPFYDDIEEELTVKSILKYIHENRGK